MAITAHIIHVALKKKQKNKKHTSISYQENTDNGPQHITWAKTH